MLGQEIGQSQSCDLLDKELDKDLEVCAVEEWLCLGNGNNNEIERHKNSIQRRSWPVCIVSRGCPNGRWC
jgi:hypothetical protein